MSRPYEFYSNWGMEDSSYPPRNHMAKTSMKWPYYNDGNDPRHHPYDRQQPLSSLSQHEYDQISHPSATNTKGGNPRQTPDSKDEWGDNPPAKPKGGLVRIVNRFAEKCSMQGPPYIQTATRWWSRLLWVILFLAAVGAMTFHLFYLCETFAAWPVKNSITLGFSNLQFPAVTVCNVNPVRASRLTDMSADFQRFVAFLDPAYIGSSIDALPDDDEARRRRRRRRQAAQSNSNATRTRLNNLDINYDDGNFSNARDDIDESFYDDDNLDGYENTWESEAKDSPLFELQQRLRQLYSAEDSEVRKNAGHQLDDMLISCSFAGKSCYPDNFTLIPSSIYGNCYTLQYNKLISRTSGPSGGLELLLYLQTDEYLRGISPDDGLHVVVHHQKSVPFPSDEGLSVPAASHTSIALKLRRIERKGDPYSKCTSMDAYQRLRVLYTRQACQKFCEQEEIHRLCKCRDETNDYINRVMRVMSLKPCRNSSEMQCLVQVQWAFQLGNVDCNCLNPCTEFRYDKIMSSRLWPHSEYAKNVLLRSVCHLQPNDTCNILQALMPYDLPREFVKLNVFYEDLNYENITEEADYEIVQFVSDVGGTMGLWIGLSILSIMEVFQFLLELFRHVCCCRCKQGNTSSS